MQSIYIRKAVQQDAKPLSDLLITCQWATYSSLYSTDTINELVEQYYNVNRIEQEINWCNEQWHGYYIADVGGIPIGAIGGGLIDEKIGEIFVFYVHPDWHRQQVGTRLLNHFSKIQQHHYGAKEQWVAVAKGNSLAIPFYESQRFQFQYETPAYGTTFEDQMLTLKYCRSLPSF